MKKHPFHTKTRSLSRAVLLGTGISVLSFFIVSAVLALVLSLIPNPLSAVGIAGISALVISGALSSFLTVKYKGEGGFISATISAAICIILILAVSLIAGKGAMGTRGIMNTVTYASVSLLFSYFGTKTGKRQRGHHR